MYRLSLVTLSLAALLVVTGCEETEQQQKQQQSITFPLAGMDIEVGTRISKGDITPQALTAEEARALPRDAVARVDQIVDRVVKEKIKANEPFRISKFYPQKQAELMLRMEVTVREAHMIKDVMEGLAQTAIMARQEPGCLRYDVFRSGSPKHPNRFLVFQEWHRKDDYTQHLADATYEQIFNRKVKAFSTVGGEVLIPVERSEQ